MTKEEQILCHRAHILEGKTGNRQVKFKQTNKQKSIGDIKKTKNKRESNNREHTVCGAALKSEEVSGQQTRNTLEHQADVTGLMVMAFNTGLEFPMAIHSRFK